MNNIYFQWFLLVMALLLIPLGIHHIVRFFAGYGAKYHRFSWYQERLSQGDLNLWQRWVLSRYSSYWMSTEKPSTPARRMELLVSGLLQLLLGILMAMYWVVKV